MSVSAWNLFRSGLTPCHHIILPKKAILIHLNRCLSVLGFRFSCLHIHNTFSSILSWSLPYSSKPAIKMSSRIPKKFGMPMNNSSILFLNISPTVIAPDGSLMYKYLPNGHQMLLDMIYHLL